jgi:RNA polymerase primary sigma factor
MDVLIKEIFGRQAKLGVPTLQSPERSSANGEATFKLYLREVGQVKCLTPQEEVELAARIKRGDKKARDQMIKSNLRLVVKIAREYEDLGLPLLDLVSEGSIGLIKAVERFDPAKGGELSTCVAWWIKQSIKRALTAQSKLRAHHPAAKQDVMNQGDRRDSKLAA